MEIKAGDRFKVTLGIEATEIGSSTISLDNQTVTVVENEDTMGSSYIIKLKDDGLGRLVDKYKFDRGIKRNRIFKIN